MQQTKTCRVCKHDTRHTPQGCTTHLCNCCGLECINHDIHIASFGFALRNPPEGFSVYDARIIKNPAKRYAGTGKTGLDEEVRDYVIGTSIEAQLLVARMARDILENGVTMAAVGCAWGHHRSVSIAEAVARYVSSVRRDDIGMIHFELLENFDVVPVFQGKRHKFKR